MQFVIAATVVISAALLYASLTRDCFFIGPAPPRSVPPLTIVLFGLFTLGDTVAWAANPLLICSWTLMAWRHSRPAVPFVAAAALAAALSFQLVVGDEIMTHEGGGADRPVLGVGAGYWLWILSIGVTLFGSIVAWLGSMSDDNTDGSNRRPRVIDSVVGDIDEDAEDLGLRDDCFSQGSPLD